MVDGLIDDSHLQVDPRSERNPLFLDEFVDWSLRNHLKLNPEKCQAINIMFVSWETRIHVRISQSLNYVHHTKVLGIYIQEEDTQVKHICKNANKRIFILSKLKRFGFNTNELIII